MSQLKSCKGRGKAVAALSDSEEEAAAEGQNPGGACWPPSCCSSPATHQHKVAYQCPEHAAARGRADELGELSSQEAPAASSHSARRSHRLAAAAAKCQGVTYSLAQAGMPRTRIRCSGGSSRCGAAMLSVLGRLLLLGPASSSVSPVRSTVSLILPASCLQRLGCCVSGGWIATDRQASCCAVLRAARRGRLSQTVLAPE